jgi:histone-lysine N-methyltransferase SETD3
MDLLEFVANRGAVVQKVCVAASAEGVRGLFAMDDIAAGETIISSPTNALVTMDRLADLDPALADSILSSGVNFHHGSDVIMAVYMLLDRLRGTKAEFMPYWESLPKSFDEMPIFWDDEQLQWLQGSPVLDAVAEKKAHLGEDFERLVAAVPAVAHLKRGDFDWAMANISSRSFQAQVGRTASMLLVGVLTFASTFKNVKASSTTPH